MSQEELQSLLTRLASERWVQALVAVAASLAAALLAELFLTRGVGRLTRRSSTDVDDHLIRYLRRPIFVSIVLVGLNLALLRLEIGEPYHRYVLGVFKTVAILLWLAFGARATRLVLELLSRHHKRFRLVQPQTLPLFDTAAKVLIFGGGAYFLLLAWHVNISAWVTSAGIVGLAVGLAARDTLANLFAGLSILAEAPCKVGDFVVLESGDRGEVTWIGVRSSRIMTRDDIEIVVPNSQLANSRIHNEAGGPTRKHRLRVQVSVAYGSDIDRVRALLLEVAAEHAQVCPEPTPRVRFRRFADSGLEIELLAWVDEPVLRGRVLDALNSEIYKRFNHEGIEFPYPKRDVYIKAAPPGFGG